MIILSIKPKFQYFYSVGGGPHVINPTFLRIVLNSPFETGTRWSTRLETRPLWQRTVLGRSQRRFIHILFGIAARSR